MKQSLRAKRKARHHKRLGAAGKLNLVSLMDIFTILVFFLMVNQSEVRVLQNNKELNLPVSVAEQLPKENIVIAVFDDRVLVQERLVWQKTDLSSKSAGINAQLEVDNLLASLKKELNYQSSKRPELSELEQENGRSVTIIGDASIEYHLLKQIMAMCAETDYRNMSLAVEQVARDKVVGGS
jgi:biopolymer transport protein ExbD